MYKAKIHIKIILDDRMVGTQAERNMLRALVEERDIIDEQTNHKVELAWSVVITTRFSSGDVEWTGSMFNGHPMYIPSASWVAMIDRLHDEPNTYVLLVFHPSSWKDPDHIIGGVNMFQTGILNPRETWSVKNWRHTIIHEMLHHFDNRAREFEGVSFEKALGTNKAGITIGRTAWDWEVVHENYMSQFAGYFNYLWGRITDAIIAIYGYNGDMLNLVITPDNHQWVVGVDGIARRIYNVETLHELHEAGVISSLTPTAVPSVTDGGNEWITLNRE